MRYDEGGGVYVPVEVTNVSTQKNNTPTQSTPSQPSFSVTPPQVSTPTPVAPKPVVIPVFTPPQNTPQPSTPIVVQPTNNQQAVIDKEASQPQGNMSDEQRAYVLANTSKPLVATASQDSTGKLSLDVTTKDNAMTYQDAYSTYASRYGASAAAQATYSEIQSSMNKPIGVDVSKADIPYITDMDTLSSGKDIDRVNRLNNGDIAYQAQTGSDVNTRVDSSIGTNSGLTSLDRLKISLMAGPAPNTEQPVNSTLAALTNPSNQINYGGNSQNRDAYLITNPYTGTQSIVTHTGQIYTGYTDVNKSFDSGGYVSNGGLPIGTTVGGVDVGSLYAQAARPQASTGINFNNLLAYGQPSSPAFTPVSANSSPTGNQILGFFGTNNDSKYSELNAAWKQQQNTGNSLGDFVHNVGANLYDTGLVVYEAGKYNGGQATKAMESAVDSSTGKSITGVFDKATNPNYNQPYSFTGEVVKGISDLGIGATFGMSEAAGATIGLGGYALSPNANLSGAAMAGVAGAGQMVVDTGAGLVENPVRGGTALLGAAALGAYSGIGETGRVSVSDVSRVGKTDVGINKLSSPDVIRGNVPSEAQPTSSFTSRVSSSVFSSADSIKNNVVKTTDSGLGTAGRIWSDANKVEGVGGLSSRGASLDTMTNPGTEFIRTTEAPTGKAWTVEGLSSAAKNTFSDIMTAPSRNWQEKVNSIGSNIELSNRPAPTPYEIPVNERITSGFKSLADTDTGRTYNNPLVDYYPPRTDLVGRVDKTFSDFGKSVSDSIPEDFKLSNIQSGYRAAKNIIRDEASDFKSNLNNSIPEDFRLSNMSSGYSKAVSILKEEANTQVVNRARVIGQGAASLAGESRWLAVGGEGSLGRTGSIISHTIEGIKNPPSIEQTSSTWETPSKTASANLNDITKTTIEGPSKPTNYLGDTSSKKANARSNAYKESLTSDTGNARTINLKDITGIQIESPRNYVSDILGKRDNARSNAYKESIKSDIEESTKKVDNTYNRKSGSAKTEQVYREEPRYQDNVREGTIDKWGYKSSVLFGAGGLLKVRAAPDVTPSQGTNVAPSFNIGSRQSDITGQSSRTSIFDRSAVDQDTNQNVGQSQSSKQSDDQSQRTGILSGGLLASRLEEMTSTKSRGAALSGSLPDGSGSRIKTKQGKTGVNWKNPMADPFSDGLW